MGYKVGYEIPISRLEDLKSECRFMINLCNTIIPKRRELIEYGGNTDFEMQRLNCKFNPEDYYKFRMWDRGCEIIYTSYRYDTNLDKFIRGKEYFYSVRYYNCKSNVFKDKRINLKFNTNNTSYGCFKELKEAYKFFRMAVIDIMQQFGACKMLNPLDFIEEELN